ncbi:hypothetical protein ACR77J_13780 [Tissierella praeacuta]|uniref:hypothetical protein n=1 Tax=Tissierella praeacuta TaxID=43131 RepID=UPI003DA3DFAE
MSKDQVQNIIIFGAGACEDLPIDFICDRFEEVVLVDNDNEVLLNSKKYIPTHMEQKVTYVVMDVAGLMSQFMQEISSGNIDSYEKGIRYLNEISHDLPEIILPKEILEKMPFSFVVSDLIISQICNDYLLMLSMLTTSKYKVSSGVDISLFSKSIILKHIELLHSLCSPTGRVMVLADTFSLGTEIDGSDSAFNMVLQDYGSSILQEENITNSMIVEWFSKYPHIIGGNILSVLKKHKYNKLELDTMYFGWWKFSLKQMYFVICHVFLPL